ncbi:polyamine ABC transporter substrate-binding protein [Rhodoplanes roseus]|uniref:Putrescine-binding periplasmic protein n=1 Tax=Rhodoplanes roseus TaxID=29409 RepID=A0A327L4I0_9BRAD|nr:polyamine ABC transporter substrate-binding protein [Rhodoplanes roseus]RAI44743.1 spermidine/putrescine ABC transporter substrate-binding protein PotF [Rhodoplanes roseus]
MRPAAAARRSALLGPALPAVAVILLASGAPLLAQERVVNVYNWSDYIAPDVVDAFSRETGIRVRYDTFDSNDTLETKLLAGKSGYDVVVPSAFFLERQIKAGVFLPLDKANLPNLKNAWPEIESRVATHDPGNRYSVNYLWGTVGIGYNVAKAREILGPGVEIDSWDIVFTPETLQKFKACGVHMLDSADDMMPAALHWLGLDPNSTDPKDLDRAAEVLTKVRPSVRKFHSSEYLNALAGGEICLVVGFSGDIMQAKKRAAEAKNGVEVGYAIPKEGAQMFFDQLAIPKDAEHVAEAHAFIDYLLRPDVAARTSSVVSYANGNLASQPLIDKAVLDDKSIYPVPATMARLYTNKARDAKTTRLMNRLWTRIKTGR